MTDKAIEAAANPMKRLLFDLSPMQASAVVALFFATSIGALLLAVAFRRWNKRRAG